MCISKTDVFFNIILHRFFAAIAALVIAAAPSLAQTGSISGTVTDKSNNEVLIGANVLLIGTSVGASTDIDGHFEIKNLAPGTYTLRFSFVSYQNLLVENIIVKPGDATVINASLTTSTTELQEVVITAEVLKNSEASVLKIQKNSDNIVDGVSAELISKNSSTDGTDVLKRMTGVTISEGKFVYVRGVSDRYNNTLLNGASLPSTDPEKKSFSYDLFPASLIEDIITAKTFTPDKPADFSGGLVQISTIEFPSNFILDISTSSSYNSNTTGKNFFAYSGGRKDYLGFDDGTRGLPGTITATRIARGNFSDNQLAEITKSFNKDWTTFSYKAPFNGSLKINLGNKIDFDENTFGYIGSLTYSNGVETKGFEKNFYDFSGARYNYVGNIYTHSVTWGGLFNASYKFGGTNKISFKNVYNQNADDVTTQYNGEYRYTDQYREINSLNYVSRTLMSNQLIGEHRIDLFSGLNWNWNLSYSRSKRDEPDTRRYMYARGLDDPTQPLRFQLDQSLVTRYYGNLTDHNYNVSTDFTFKFFDDPAFPKMKTGYLFDKKDRVFDARSFGFKNIAGGNFAHEDSVLQGPIDNIFDPENITTKFIQVTELTKPSDSYGSKQTINAGYVMFDMMLFNTIKIVTGARLENSRQNLNAIDLLGDTINVDDNYNDVLPSVNLTYLFNDWINVRGAYSITLSRPEFRELAPFSYFDFINNELIEGNPNLKRTLVNNYDFRVELYPSPGELAAVSFFYKKFRDPIEEVLQASANEPIRSFENASSASNYGLEIELRKNFLFISEALQNVSFVGNASLIKSKVEFTAGGFQEKERALQGQPPYIFNVGLYYDDADAGFNSSVTYNKVGEKIAKVGSKDLGNILEMPVDLVDVSLSQRIFEYFTMKFSVKDIFNHDRIQIQQSPLGDKTAELERTGRTFSLGISYKL
ncbi:MAG: TonB-dependent receptor [Bacteroidota bacterium]|jgi:outer membrane receptor protein involved in Fe transport